MKTREKFEGCNPLIKTLILNGLEVLCNAETAETVRHEGNDSHGPFKTWIVDYRMSPFSNDRFYYDHNGIAYRKADPID